MVNKRKRDGWSDTDSDDISPGKQILPVANLPHDFDQEPQDGLQYLFLVRRDARRLPHTTRVRNPYEVSQTKVVYTVTPSSTNVLPCEEWKVAFQTHFSHLRKNLTQTTVRVDHDHSSFKQRAIPEKKDRDGWWKFLTGHPESAWSPRSRLVRKKLCTPCFAEPTEAVLPGDETSLPGDEPCLDDLARGILRRSCSPDAAVLPINLPTSSKGAREEHIERLSPPEVTPTHLREIDHRMSIHLLMYFTHWINVHLQNPSCPLTTISASHGRWIFALLTKIEDRLSADEMNLVRNLARACLGLIQRYRGEHTESATVLEGASTPVLVGDTTHMSDVSCWMVFAAVAEYWGQRDLWADAGVTLAGV